MPSLFAQFAAPDFTAASDTLGPENTQRIQAVYEEIASGAPLTPESKEAFVHVVNSVYGGIRSLKLRIANKFLGYNPATGPADGRDGDVWSENSYLSHLVAAMRADSGFRNAVFDLMLNQDAGAFSRWATEATQFMAETSKSEPIAQDIEDAYRRAGGEAGIAAKFAKRGSAPPAVDWRSGVIENIGSPDTLSALFPWLRGRALSAKQSGMRARTRRAVLLLLLHDLVKPGGDLDHLRSNVDKAFDMLKTKCTPENVERARSILEQHNGLLRYAMTIASHAHDLSAGADDESKDGRKRSRRDMTM